MCYVFNFSFLPQMNTNQHGFSFSYQQILLMTLISRVVSLAIVPYKGLFPFYLLTLNNQRKRAYQ